MSKTSLNYWSDFAIDIPLGIILIVTGLRNHELGFIPVPLAMLLGMFLFSFAEYSVHRWLFHGSVTVLAQGHHAHHENPFASQKQRTCFQDKWAQIQAQLPISKIKKVRQ